MDTQSQHSRTPVAGLAVAVFSLVVMILLSASAPTLANDVPLAEEIAYTGLFGVKTASVGTRDTGGNARLILNLPGDPESCFLYLAGFDSKEDGLQFPDGDTRVRVRIVDGNGVATVLRDAPVAYRCPKDKGLFETDKGFVSKLDITGSISAGRNRIRVSGYDLDSPDGAVALCVYNDPTRLTDNSISIQEGADLGWYGKDGYKGPDTEVVTFTFPPSETKRKGKVRLFFGEAEAKRGDEIFVYSNFGSAGDWLGDTDGDGLLDIVDRRVPLIRVDRGRLRNDPVNFKGRLEAVRGARSLEEDKLGVPRRFKGYSRKASLDAFIRKYNVPVSHEFASFQAQSEDPEHGEKMLLFLAVHEVDMPLPPPTPVIDASLTATAGSCQVEYNLYVENSGDRDYHPVLRSDKGYTYDYIDGDTQQDGWLDFGETWHYRAIAAGLAAGPQNDTVTVTTASGQSVEATLPDSVIVACP